MMKKMTQKQTLTRRPSALRRNKKGGYLAALVSAAVVVCLGGIFAFSVFAANKTYVLVYKTDDNTASGFTAGTTYTYDGTDYPATIKENATSGPTTAAGPASNNRYLVFHQWNVWHQNNKSFYSLNAGNSVGVNYFKDPDSNGNYVTYAEPIWYERLSVKFIYNNTSSVVADGYTRPQNAPSSAKVNWGGF